MKWIRAGIMFLAMVAVTVGLDGLGAPHARHFAFSISVEETTLPQGQSFIVDLELRNRSRHDIEIAVFVVWAFPHIPGWRYPVQIFEMPQHPYMMLIDAGDTLQRQWGLGSNLVVGSHGLRFRTRFNVNWGQHNNRHIEIWSNTVVLTVI